MKKNKFILPGALLIAGVVAMSGCKKLADFGDTNQNPNGSVSFPTKTLLSTSQVRLGNNGFGTVLTTATPAAELLSGLMAQYFAEPTYPGASRYAATNLQVNFGGTYSGILKDLQTIIDRNTDPATAVEAANYGSNSSQIAIARILKAWVYWHTTDKWGDIPYSEALKGAAILNPKYDTQESIYTDLLKELDEAVDQFAGVNLVQGDLIYAGDELKWKKFANSVRMLIALRMSKVYPAPGGLASVKFNEALEDAANSGIMETNADNFSFFYPGNANPFQNPWYGPANSNDNGSAKTMTDLMVGLNDSRAASFFTNTNGIPFGLVNAVPTGTWARILAPQFKQPTGTVVLLGSAAVLLAKAEAIQRGWVTNAGTAKAAYDAALTASFAQWGVSMPAGYLTTSAAAFDNGVGVASIGGTQTPGANANTAVGGDATTADNKLRRIQLQQFIAFYPWGAQGWANWRRTAMPDLKPTATPITAGAQIPRRLTYGTNEYLLNGAKVAQAAAQMGGDDQDTRVWWDRP